MIQESGKIVTETTQGRGNAITRVLTSIRSRLIVFLIAFSIVPIILTASIVSPVGIQNARQRLYGTLQAITTLKQNLIVEWVTTLHTNLTSIIDKDAGLRRLPTLLRTSPDAEVFRPVYIAQLVELQSEITARGIFDEIYMADLEGNVVIATEPGLEELNIAEEEYFIKGLDAQYLQPPFYDFDRSALIVIVAQPVISTLGSPIGVLVGRANVDQLNALLLDRTGLGQTGETYLVGIDYTLLSIPRFSGYQPGSTQINSNEALQAIKDRSSGVAEYRNYENLQVFGAYQWIPELNTALFVEQHRTEALVFVRATNTALLVSALATLALAVVAALLIGRNMTQPLTELTEAADDIREGSFESHDQIKRLSADRQDEIGSLASAFNAMIDQLRYLIDNLEQRVSERTMLLQNRSEQLQAAAEVSRSATTLLDLDRLMQHVVDVIQNRFDLYYVGLFLTDEPVSDKTLSSETERPRWAILRAGTGEAGMAMIARNHKLQIGGGSMIGWSIANAQARIALEAGEDPERLATPDLPETRSEAAIPLRSRGQVLGALTIQSSIPDAFDSETIAVFQTMADQIATAVDNARLFAETELALETSRRAFGEITGQAWTKRLRKSPLSFSIGQIKSADKNVTENLDQILSSSEDASASRDSEPFKSATNGSEESELLMPIKIRDKVIGYVNASKQLSTQQEVGRHSPTDGSTQSARSSKWQADEISMLSNLIDQLGVALDSARLFEETQARAERERLVGDLTTRMRASLDIETVLQTAAHEIRRALNLEEVEVRLGTEEQE